MTTLTRLLPRNTGVERDTGELFGLLTALRSCCEFRVRCEFDVGELGELGLRLMQLGRFGCGGAHMAR